MRDDWPRGRGRAARGRRGARRGSRRRRHRPAGRRDAETGQQRAWLVGDVTHVRKGRRRWVSRTTSSTTTSTSSATCGRTGDASPARSCWLPIVVGLASYGWFTLPTTRRPEGAALRDPRGGAGRPGLVVASGRSCTWLTTRYVVTDRRVLMRSGVLSRNGRDVPLTRVNDVSFQRTLVERHVRLRHVDHRVGRRARSGRAERRPAGRGGAARHLPAGRGRGAAAEVISRARSVGLGAPIWIGVAGVVVTLLAARNLALAPAVVIAVAMAVVTVATAVAEALRHLVVRMRRTPLRCRGLDLGEFRMPSRAPRIFMRPPVGRWLQPSSRSLRSRLWGGCSGATTDRDFGRALPRRPRLRSGGSHPRSSCISPATRRSSTSCGCGSRRSSGSACARCVVVRSDLVDGSAGDVAVAGDLLAVQRHDRLAAVADARRRAVRHAQRQQPVDAAPARDA